jgi:hypothetical protein
LLSPSSAGGLLSTWLPIYGLSVDDLRGILKSFHSVFPHVQVWYENFQPHEKTIVIASMPPIAIDPASLARRLGSAAVASDLAEVGIALTFQVLDFFVLGDRAVAEFCARQPWPLISGNSVRQAHGEFGPERGNKGRHHYPAERESRFSLFARCP